jgi:hypothetical protein
LGTEVWAFEKIDGSYFRIEWQRKLSKKSFRTGGFGKFGTRTQLITNTSQNFGDGVDYFDEHFTHQLDDLFSKEQFFKKYDKITVFCEYWGEHSFCGKHNDSDKKKLTIIDLHLQKYGIIHPENFYKYLKDFDIAKLIYHGELTDKFLKDVYNGKYPVNEGVMAKASIPVNKSERTIMGKIKTKSWLENLKTIYGVKAVEAEMQNKSNI